MPLHNCASGLASKHGIQKQTAAATTTPTNHDASGVTALSETMRAVGVLLVLVIVLVLVLILALVLLQN